ncbi:DUF6196 family protein [Nocardia sp. NPDC051463]|uniref:DUF6196 family protein n=1 Tax=Nocardia sp. NPDC051463 TaxID=3154845 RepID=UPI00345007AB
MVNVSVETPEQTEQRLRRVVAAAEFVVHRQRQPRRRLALCGARPTGPPGGTVPILGGARTEHRPPRAWTGGTARR